VGGNEGIGQDYRPTHDFGHSVLNDGRHMYPGRDLVQFGETVTAEITFLAPEYQRGWLYDGMAFKIQEGSKIVGHGVIRTVFDPQMRKT
jgi:translation elongation factor EF-Tu-like GTPase